MNPVSQDCVERPALPEVLIEEWLSAETVGGEFLVKGKTVQRWRRNGIIPPSYLKKFGKCHYKFHPAVVSFLENKIAEAHSQARAARV